jgi:hypothetical protein
MIKEINGIKVEIVFEIISESKTGRCGLRTNNLDKALKFMCNQKKVGNQPTLTAKDVKQIN